MLSSFSIKQKFLLISLIAAVGFALFLISTYLYGAINAQRLQQVRDVYVPALEITNLNTARFERITELFRSAAVSSEKDFVKQAEMASQDFSKDLSRLKRLTESRINKATLSELESGFQQYFSSARNLSLKIIDSQQELEFESYGEEILAMNKAEERTRILLNDILEQTRKTFFSSVDEANKSTRHGVIIGAIIGIVTVMIILMAGIQITNLVIGTIKAVNRSLRNMGEGEGILTNELDSPSDDEIGELVGSVNFLNDQLRILATTDRLTELKNFAYFQEELHRRVHEYCRYKSKECLSLVIFDLDHFKKFNDTYGHIDGNTAPKHAASLIKELARKADICCRYGGEEFVVILPMSDLKGAGHYAERVRKHIERTPVKLEEQEVFITASAGCATYRPEEDLVSLINRADEALYQAKEQGRNIVVLEADEVTK